MTDEQQAKYLANIRIAHMLARKYRPPVNWTREDWNQECLLVFAKAVVYHREELGALSTIADRLIFNRWGEENIKRKYKKRGMNVAHVSIGLPGADEGDNDIANLIVAKPDPDSVGIKDLNEFLVRCIDPVVLDVFKKLAQGVSLREIGETVGFSKQAIGLAVGQARNWILDLFPDLVPPGANCKKCDKAIAPIRGVVFCSGCARYLRWRRKINFMERKKKEVEK